MMKHNLNKSHSTIQNLLSVPKPLFSGDAAAFSLPIARKNTSTTIPTNFLKRSTGLLWRHCGGGTRVKAILSTTAAAKSTTTVKAKVTVLETLGGALSHLGSRGIDNVIDLFGKTVLLELVASELDPQSGLEKATIKSYAHKSGHNDNEYYYETSFEVNEDFGEIGAVLIENEHHREMFVMNIVFSGFSITTNDSVEVTCNSWIHPKSDNREKRIYWRY